jgi:hypothetical protein
MCSLLHRDCVEKSTNGRVGRGIRSSSGRLRAGGVQASCYAESSEIYDVRLVCRFVACSCTNFAANLSASAGGEDGLRGILWL